MPPDSHCPCLESLTFHIRRHVVLHSWMFEWIVAFECDGVREKSTKIAISSSLIFDDAEKRDEYARLWRVVLGRSWWRCELFEIVLAAVLTETWKLCGLVCPVRHVGARCWGRSSSLPRKRSQLVEQATTISTRVVSIHIWRFENRIRVARLEIDRRTV